MRRVLRICAIGGPAQQVVPALNQIDNIALTLFVRNKSRLQINTSQDCTIIKRDAMQFESVKNAVADHDIVYVNLAGNLEAQINNRVKAMQETGA